MFDNIKFAVEDFTGRHLPIKLTALGLLNFLCDTKLINRENSFDVCNWLAHAEPRQEYNAGTFRIIALDY